MHSVRREGRRARAARGALAAAIAIATAATAHTLAGDGAPPVWLLLAVTALAAPLAVWLTGRALSTWRTAAIVILSQTLLHAAFAATLAKLAARYVLKTHVQQPLQARQIFPRLLHTLLEGKLMHGVQQQIFRRGKIEQALRRREVRSERLLDQHRCARLQCLRCKRRV